MPGYTPLYSIPYPIAADPLDDAVSTIPQAQATAVESTIAGFGGIAAPGAWVSVGAGGGAPAFGAGFGNYGSGFTATQYRKVGNQLFVRGLIATSAGVAANATMFVLPAGFRPLATQMLWCTTSVGGGGIRVDIQTNGIVCAPVTAIPIANYVALWFPTIWLD